SCRRRSSAPTPSCSQIRLCYIASRQSRYFHHFARDGGLMGYGPNFLSYFRHAGIMAAKILRGASPADTPIDRPAKFEFVLNLTTAALLDVTIPPATLLRADEVIE